MEAAVLSFALAAFIAAPLPALLQKANSARETIQTIEASTVTPTLVRLERK